MLLQIKILSIILKGRFWRWLPKSSHRLLPDLFWIFLLVWVFLRVFFVRGSWLVESGNFLLLDPRLILLRLFAYLRACLSFLLVQIWAAFRLPKLLLTLNGFLARLVLAQHISILVEACAAFYSRLRSILAIVSPSWVFVWLLVLILCFGALLDLLLKWCHALYRAWWWPILTNFEVTSSLKLVSMRGHETILVYPAIRVIFISCSILLCDIIGLQSLRWCEIIVSRRRRSVACSLLRGNSTLFTFFCLLMWHFVGILRIYGAFDVCWWIERCIGKVLLLHSLVCWSLLLAVASFNLVSLTSAIWPHSPIFATYSTCWKYRALATVHSILSQLGATDLLLATMITFTALMVHERLLDLFFKHSWVVLFCWAFILRVEYLAVHPWLALSKLRTWL